ncbi:MAG: DHH family phosphoesterase [Mycoplasmatales bacterium]
MKDNQSEINIIHSKLKEYDNIYILRHQRPDFDALGSQIGLYEILKKLYPNKQIHAIGNDNITDFSFIAVNEKLNTLIKNSLIFILDTANIERIEASKYENIKDNNFIIKIDHHPNLEPYGNINIVDAKISSTSEIIYNIFIKNLKYTLTPAGAKGLYAGIYGDTGGFSYSNTSPQTFAIASELVKYDFEFENLMLNLKELDDETVRALGWFYQNIEINNGLGILKFTKEDLKKLPFSKSHLSLLVNFLGIFKSLKVWLLMVEHDNFIRVNLRSKKDINVSKIANKFEGGGHKNASGARIYKWEDSEKIITEIQKIITK